MWELLASICTSCFVVVGEGWYWALCTFDKIWFGETAGEHTMGLPLQGPALYLPYGS